MWKGLKKIKLHVIWSNCMNFMNRFWVTITYWTFEMPKTLWHNSYHMIMDSLYLLKCLIEWFFKTYKVVWCYWYKGRWFWKILKTINWNIKYNMDILLIILLILINNSNFHLLNVKFWHNYLQLIKFKSKYIYCYLAIWLMQYNIFCYNVKWTFIFTLI
jgi:hypothetical protein